ncbi:M48 family metallopeptidase [Leptolyngbya sp. AN02str]|uniref:M48 family metallopeptidase n=1 Tax=Leptolyngbya sp. AN02str TaxID=3423363 RepID=UPI003D32426E
MTDFHESALFDYRVRVSPRAKNVSIHVSHHGDVEVVIPNGFDPNHVPDIVKRRQDWIIKTTKRLERDRQAIAPEPISALPERIQLRSVAEEWNVIYQPATGGETIASSSLTSDRQLQLKLWGATHSPDTCNRVLLRWLRRKAQMSLTPWLRQVSQEVALPHSRTTIRHQKTIWASCSSRKTISLNAKLLFLPSELVRYVFIHELCHTVHLNHSSRFWALVEEKEPNYRALDQELRKGWRYVPGWAE